MKTRMIAKANVWASMVWKKTLNSWENRQQDYNYRQFLARPALKKVLKNLEPVCDGFFLDLGCGDGSEMREIQKILVEQGSSGKFFGFDFQPSLIKIAQGKIQPENSKETNYDTVKSILINKQGIMI